MKEETIALRVEPKLDRILNDINAKLPVGYESNDIISSIKKLSEEYGTIDIIIAIDQFEDILRSPQTAKEVLAKILLRIYGKSFRNIHVLLSYRGEYEPQINSFLENSGIISPSRFPLLGLDRFGAREALRSIFETNNVGILAELLDRIIIELEKESEHGRFYPPFIQIVASCLISLAKSNEGVITEVLYNKVESVKTIIGTYLINQLKDFGDENSAKRRNVEGILKELVRGGAKEQKGKDELLRYLNILESELQELLGKLVNKRLIRHLGNDNYEIIHDYLASKVEEMIKDKERPLRSARDILRTKAHHYRYMPTPSLLEPNEMVLLYSMRESIYPSVQEKELLMLSYLAKNGPVWWWFREDKESVYGTIIVKALSSPFSKVRSAAIKVFEKLGTSYDIAIIKEMSKDPDPDVRYAVVKVLGKLGTHDDIATIEEMLKDPELKVRESAVKIFEKFGNENDLQELVKKYANGEVSSDEFLKCIIALDEKVYSPFKNNILYS